MVFAPSSSPSTYSSAGTVAVGSIVELQLHYVTGLNLFFSQTLYPSIPIHTTSWNMEQDKTRHTTLAACKWMRLPTCPIRPAQQSIQFTARPDLSGANSEPSSKSSQTTTQPANHSSPMATAKNFTHSVRGDPLKCPARPHIVPSSVTLCRDFLAVPGWLIGERHMIGP